MIPLSREKAYKKQWTIGLIIAFFIYALNYLSVNPLDLFTQLPRFISFFSNRFFPRIFKE